VGLLVLVLGLTGVYITAPGSGRGGAAFVAICLSASGAVWWGTRHNATPTRAWYLLAGAPLLGGIGMGLRLGLAGVGGETVALVPDLVTIPAYLLLICWLLSLLRARRGAGADSALDGGLMAVAALLLTWALLISPLLADAQMPVTLKVVNAAYPSISVAVLFVGALIAMTEVRSITAFWALAIGWVGLATGDLVYALASVGKATLPLWAANGAYCVFYGLLGAAGLHPSMSALSRPAVRRVRGYANSRFVAVAVALLVPAGVTALRSPASSVERIVSAGLLGLLGVLVLIRITGAVNRHATSEVRLERLANQDPLTGLPNRLRLASHLDLALGRAASSGRGVAVFFMDLDQFKIVNDSWGHETGDALLTVVATRLRAAVRHGELVARVGGDEFVLVTEDVEAAADAVDLASRLLTLFDDPVSLPSGQIVVTSSVGVAFAGPHNSTATAEDLLRESDTAMYRAKARGGASVVLFDESMRTETAHRIALEGSLRGALERGELAMHYQPIVDLRSGQTTGFEALMRWQHPERGTIAPAEFIPVAEDTGLIVKLGQWAIQQATHDLSRWRHRFGALSMAVNLSPRQLRDPQLVAVVAQALHDSGLPGGALCLEITESTLMDDADATMVTLDALKQLGVSLSADDFGTGYSSLAYLRLFPFDQVKVDRSFVAGLDDGGDDDVIVAAVLSMANSLSLTTVAEGIETTHQRERLITLGADGGQGWLFAAALPVAHVTEHLEKATAAQTTNATVFPPPVVPATAEVGATPPTVPRQPSRAPTMQQRTG